LGEDAGKKGASDIYAALLANPDPNTADIAGALGNEWLQRDPGMSAVAQALLGNEFKQNDPMYQMGLERSQLELDALRNPAPADPLQVSPGETLVDPETMKPLYTGPAAAPQTVINTGDNTSAFVKMTDEEAAKRIGSIIEGGNSATSMIGDLQALAEIGRNLNTGKGAEIMSALGPYAEFLGLNVDGLDEAQAYDAIVARMAPQMRVPGSGASSDFDARQFLKSLPALGNTPDGNAIIIETFTAIQEHKVAAADIARRATLPKEQGGITWQEAEAQIARLGNPFDAFNKYSQNRGQTGALAAPEGVDPALWQVMSPEEQSLWAN